MEMVEFYIYIFIDSPWACIFRIFLFTILIYDIKALVRTIPGRAHTFLSKKIPRYMRIYGKKKTYHRFNSEQCIEDESRFRSSCPLLFRHHTGSRYRLGDLHHGCHLGL